MLLQRLVEFSDRLNLPPPLYGEGPVRYIIDLDGSGRLLSPQPVDTADPANPRTRRGTRRLVPQIQRSSSIKPLLLADKADYVLGYVAQEAKPERVAACHKAFLDLVERCAADTQEPTVGAVLQFLRNDPLALVKLPPDFDPSGVLTFRVDGVFPIDRPSVQAFWAAEHDPAAGGAQVMQCLVCGKERPVLERLQSKIKGIPGGQSSGTSIISANAAAFESYGLTASHIAPTCSVCGERFTKGLNHLLADEPSRRVIADVVVAAWTREDVGFNLFTFMDKPSPEDVQVLLDSVFRGGPGPDVDSTKFYAVSLSASGGRAVVRDWIDSTVGTVKENLARWFQGQRIVGLAGDSARPLGLYTLAMATVMKENDLPVTTPRALLRTAISGAPLPYGILHQAVQRCRAERRVTPSRAALIKLALLSTDPPSKEDEMVRLDPEHPSPAYQCGRLLAVLEAAQRAAITGINATVVDRFYGTASTAPASVFPRLLRGVQPHLTKLGRDRRGAYVALQQRLEEILGRLARFPSTLTLQEQGLFALGYYHQRAYERERASEAAERRRAGQAIEEEVHIYADAVEAQEE
jgi:CRISPR-associated protein Csd1